MLSWDKLRDCLLGIMGAGDIHKWREKLCKCCKVHTYRDDTGVKRAVPTKARSFSNTSIQLDSPDKTVLIHKMKSQWIWSGSLCRLLWEQCVQNKHRDTGLPFRRKSTTGHNSYGCPLHCPWQQIIRNTVRQPPSWWAGCVGTLGAHTERAPGNSPRDYNSTCN